MSKFWSVFGPIKFEVRGQILVPGGQNLRVPRLDFGLFGVRGQKFFWGPGLIPTQTLQGSERNFLKALWLRESDRSHEGPTAVQPKLTKLVRILTFWQKFYQILRKFSRNFLMILMIFEILSWPRWVLDDLWCLRASSISVFLDCVARGSEVGNFGFLAILTFWLLGFLKNSGNLAEIFHHNFWLWGVISWRVRLEVQRSNFGFWVILGHFWHFWLMICHLFWSNFGHFGHFGRFLGQPGVREGLARWRKDPQRAAEGLAGSGRGQGPRSGGLRVGFWLFWSSGVKIWGSEVKILGRWVPGVKIWGSGSPKSPSGGSWGSRPLGPKLRGPGQRDVLVFLGSQNLGDPKRFWPGSKFEVGSKLVPDFGQNLLGQGRGKIWGPGVDFGHFGPFWDILGPCPESGKIWSGLMDPSKRWLYARDFWSESGRRVIWGQNLTEVSSLGGSILAILGDFGILVILGDFGSAGSGRVWPDGWILTQGRGQRAAEVLAGVWEGSGTEVWRGSRVRFWPFWVPRGVPGIKIWGSGSILVPGVKNLRGQEVRFFGPGVKIWGWGSGVGFWSILGHFGTFLGPCPESGKLD